MCTDPPACPAGGMAKCVCVCVYGAGGGGGQGTLFQLPAKPSYTPTSWRMAPVPHSSSDRAPLLGLSPYLVGFTRPFYPSPQVMLYKRPVEMAEAKSHPHPHFTSRPAVISLRRRRPWSAGGIKSPGGEGGADGAEPCCSVTSPPTGSSISISDTWCVCITWGLQLAP